MPKHKKLTLKLGIQTYQILTNDDEVCIPSLSNILLAVSNLFCTINKANFVKDSYSYAQ